VFTMASLDSIFPILGNTWLLRFRRVALLSSVRFTVSESMSRVLAESGFSLKPKGLVS
jgi:hypothetical protein